ncbi:MAG: hypothetical protein AAFW59_09280, partial [Pseudomonadota bacterium]
MKSLLCSFGAAGALLLGACSDSATETSAVMEDVSSASSSPAPDSVAGNLKARQPSEKDNAKVAEAREEFDILVASFEQVDQIALRKSYENSIAKGYFKGSFQEWRDESRSFFLSEPNLFLDDCVGPSVYGIEYRADRDLTFYAYEYLRLRRLMDNYSVPQQASRPVLDKFVDAVLADEALGTNALADWIQTGSGQLPEDPYGMNDGYETYGYLAKIAEDVNANWKDTDRLIYPYAEGCGAGEEIIEMTTAPSGGSIFLISHFKKLVCEGRGIDPFDTRKCAGWSQLIDGSVGSVVGDYFYVVRWPDGESAQGAIGFDDSRYENAV